MSLKPGEVENNKYKPQSVRRLKPRVLRFLILVLILVTIVGLYVLKNSQSVKSENDSSSAAAGSYQSAEFNLDATANFNLEQVLAHQLPVIIDFGADSCVPCKEMAPVLVALNKELRGKAVVKFVDVWKNTKAATGLPLEVIPTQFFFNADGSPYVPADPDAAAKNGFIMYTTKDTKKHVYTVHQGGLDKATILAVLKEMGMK